MKRAILDTDIFSEILKGRNAAVAAAAKNYRAAFGRFSISSITVMELVRGMGKKGRAVEVTRLMEYVDASEMLDFDRSAAELAGRIYADLERTGQPIGRADPMIAGIAISWAGPSDGKHRPLPADSRSWVFAGDRQLA